MSQIAAIVLAAGTSSRFGHAKQLLPWGERPLLSHVLGQTLGARVDPVIVVLGHQAPEILNRLPEKDQRLRFVINPDYEKGMSSSVKAGMNSVPPEAIGVVFLLGDQPLIETRYIQAVLSGFEKHYQGSGRIIVASAWRGRYGHPILFGHAFFDDLLQLEGDEGGRSVLKANKAKVVEVPLDKEAFLDIDTREDYQRLLALERTR